MAKITIKQIVRILHIQSIMAKNGLDQVLVSLGWIAPLQYLVYLNPWNWFRRCQKPRGEALRQTLEELGPIFIKFGQALSTRPDILPPDLASALAKLQDQVPPCSTQHVLTTIEEAFGQSAFELFASFDETPLASASIAQVHAATLKSGESVVVKVLRPQIKQQIMRDVQLLKVIAHQCERYWPQSRRYKPKQIVLEFEHHLLDEIDLQREAGNAAQLRRNFEKNTDLLHVPHIHWDYVRQNVLVMERIHGIPVSDLTALDQHHINRKKLAQRGLEIFFLQVFRDCFFHADMHPGNIFVSYDHPNNPQYICVDFGIIGTLTAHDQRYLAENLLAFFNRDYRRVAQLHVDSCWVARTTRVEDFESAIRTVCEPIFEKPLKDLSFAQLVLRLLQVAQRFHMEVQPQLILLQKTLLAVEGLGRQIDPHLNLWTSGKPFLEQWVRDQIGPRAFFRHMRNNIPFFMEQLPYMPQLINDVLLLSKERQQREMIKEKPVKQRSQGYLIGITGFLAGLVLMTGVMLLVRS